ncbi:hypothetical protein EV669_105120 [Gulbenkiania mobilis]|uniref:Mu-like prophage I protein n=1 Tax=Gulbenkiania mobilis TaxID=397457 RepID=A0ABY2CWP2_GULMO|nr:hypothetical protein EV669_105120 [Gulbenkiania mobilis]
MYTHPSLISSFDASAGPWQPDAPGQPVARLHIFKAGLHTSGNGITRLYTADELAAMAAAYDPARFAAPLVIGHPQDNTPAYGWVARLVAEGDDLFAEVDTIDPLLADAIRVGMYRKISASLYLPESPANPVPGVLYLRHVGLLGGAAPAVKGLAPVTLSEGDGVAEFEEVCRKQSEQGDPVMSDQTPELAELKAKLAAIEAENASLKAAAEAATAALNEQKRAATHAEHAAFAEALVKAGKLTPGVAPAMVATLDYLAESSADFAEGGQQEPLVKVFREALSALPAVIPMGEAAADHSEAEIKPIGQMSGHEAAALFQRDPQAFRRAAGLTE